jgi:hypothetical protein
MTAGRNWKTAAIAVTSTGSTAILAAVTGKRHMIHAIFLVASAATNINFLTGSTYLTGSGSSSIQLVANEGFTISLGDAALPCGTSEALNITQSGTAQIAGFVIYTDEV